MIKHTQTTCWLLPTNSLSMFDHFKGLAIEGLTKSSIQKTFQARSQDLNQPLQDTAQNFDYDVIIMTLTSSS